jgi:alpha-L-fucosidase
MMKRGLALAFVFLITLTVSAPWATSQQEGVVPAYNSGPPAKGVKLPAILDKDQLWGDNAQYRYQTHAYDLAAKIPTVLHQQPCYCYCDRMGHNSLHSCFESTHGARCDICLKELYYSYSEHQKGKTAAQIRKGIMQGEWRQVNLETAAASN